MFQHMSFDVGIDRNVNSDLLGWPQSASELGYTGNREYSDMSEFTWEDAQQTYQEEQALISRIEDATSADDEYEAITDELYEDPGCLYGLDIGIASTVIALSAAGCISFSSCSGGAFGGHHHECHPVVAFYVRPRAFNALLECAKESDVGFSNGGAGEGTIYAQCIPAMMLFAKLLIDRRKEFTALGLDDASPPSS